MQANKPHQPKLRHITAAVALTLLGGAAVAQSTDNGKLESVIVTANKRAQNLEDVAVIVDDVPLGMQAGAFKDLPTSVASKC
ncbi:hypothetical protein [Duganella sp. BuS-21]|uniref:hypothetical protein n=1 Tax=Duganella sp. BuS-21 TaxID=2943848 RepID=UPI0035A72721